MAESGRYQSLKRLVDLGKNEMKKRSKPNFRNYAVKKIDLKGDCVVCGESRAVEICHIIPICCCRLIENYRELASDKENCLRLCKNHHWMFDHKLLTDKELYKIYDSKKDFIESVLLDAANSKFVKKQGEEVSAADYKSISYFVDWIKWCSRVFYKKLC